MGEGLTYSPFWLFFAMANVQTDILTITEVADYLKVSPFFVSVTHRSSLWSSYALSEPATAAQPCPNASTTVPIAVENAAFP